MRAIETPVDGPTARRLLSPSQDPGKPMSKTRFSAILGAMGKAEQRLVFISEIVKFLKDHPDFSEKEYYKKKVDFRLGQVIPSRSLPRAFRFSIEDLKDGKPIVLKLVNGEAS